MADTNSQPISMEALLYVLNHVFLPPKLPQEDDYDAGHDFALCQLAYQASLEFAPFLSVFEQKKWDFVSRMLNRLSKSTSVVDKDELVRDILHLEDGDALAFHIRAQNAALILRRLQTTMVFEVFEVSPPPEAFMTVHGKLIRSYPGPAVELPLGVAQDRSFVEQLVSFLSQMDVDRLPGAQATATKAGSKVPETRGTIHPRYISQLLIMILRGMGNEAAVTRITKRIADDVCGFTGGKPWRRSPLWLVLRVAMQTTADSHETYKSFMVFFHAKFLQLFGDHDLPSELIHAARVKTSRRVHKLGDSVSPHLLQTVMGVSRTTEERLQDRWSKEQHLQASSPSYTPDPFAIEKDTTMSLVESRPYLNKVLSPDSYMDTFTQFQPVHFPRVRDSHDFHNLCPEGLSKAVQADPRIALADFEFLVQERLDDWVAENGQNESACETLGSCMEQYITAAKTHYTSNPEDESIMLLTIMELWVALDTIASIHCPLLLFYSPEIPSSFLEPLLLRRAKFIDRAAQIERHLCHRHSKATIETSIYSSTFERSSFAVRYFQKSPTLQATKASIEQHATVTRESKRTELLRANAKHASLTRQIAASTCSYVNGPSGPRHSISCHKCKLQSEVEVMIIAVHEWPLPDRALEAEAIIFELQCPPAFAIWRARTYQILRDFGMAHAGAQPRFNPNVLLEDYEGLTKWATKGTTSGRVALASETKSFLNNYYRHVPIPANEDSVCVNNGLRFKFYDRTKREHVLSMFDLNLDSYCTLLLPKDGEGLYQHLQYAVAQTTHMHNETIVNQGDCPMNLSMHEQLAFSNLRCGPQLQWKNIARELRTNTLTFSREEVHTLITQAAWQIGPLSEDGKLREWHFELEVSEFGAVLIREATELLSHVEANWIEGTTVKTIIYLISRLLASTTGAQAQVRRNGYQFLRKARQVTHKWMREIVLKLQDAVDDGQASELQRRACDMAATCRATFDVEYGTHLDSLLCSSEDVAIAIECAIVIHDNTPPHLGQKYPDFQKLLHRDRRLSHFLEAPLIALIQNDECGLDTAISSVWSSYRPGDGGWQQLDGPHSRWLTSLTAPLPGQRAQQVHYNILTGKMLVDGKPLGRLPQEIVRHSTYSRIFGQKILDVIPADMPGMDYATRSLVHDYQVFFALRASSQNLIIRASCSGKILELVPHTVLLEDFPMLFVTEHTHWMDVQSGEVEFRPLHRLWDSSPQNWRLQFSPGSPSRMIQKTPDARLLLDIRSRTFQGISARILPLERAEYLTVVFDVPSRNVFIELPRFRLEFFINNGELESKNLQSMVIDSDQCTGTMIGLNSQLVLRHKDSSFASLPRSRCVLIPRGCVQFRLSSDKNHVRVDIDTCTNFIRRVIWDKYEIDCDLGLLVGSVNLASRLYRIYLHALDPLTGQTGTDHALQELKAAGSFSFQRLTKADIELLRLIGDITPRRHYYPKHFHAMQTIKWSPHLPALSQHGTFDTAVCKIMEYAQSLSIFGGPKQEKAVELDYKCKGDLLLMTRATQRNAIYYEAAGKTPVRTDKRYESRDSPHLSEHDSDGMEALKTSRLVYAWPVGLTRRLEPSELLETFTGWGNMKGPLEGTSLMYTQEWLQFDLPAKWLSIYGLCRRLGGSASKYELVFSFAALAYSSPSLRKFIPVLLAFATIPKSQLVQPPRHLSYNVATGFEPLRARVRSMVISGSHLPQDSPAGRLLRRPKETARNLRLRQAMHHNEHVARRADEVVDRLMMECHSLEPQSPFNHDDSRWLRTEVIMRDVTEYFASCLRNKDLRSFASQVTTVLEAHYTKRYSPKVEQMPIFTFDPEGPHICPDSGEADSPFTLANLLSVRADSTPAKPSFAFGTGAQIPRPFSPAIETSLLKKLIFQFRKNNYSKVAQLYSERLESSQRELNGHRTPVIPKHPPPINDCLAYRDRCQIPLNDVFRSIHSALSPLTTTEKILADAGLWPRIHHRSILYPLASTSKIDLSPEWIEILTTFAEVFIEYQYSQRLLGYALQSDAEKYFKELDSASFNRQDATQIPDWLLIQIQGNFITRPIQYDVAREMVAPSSEGSAILQLNMGEGKSHVIVPLVATALADSHKLVRVVVLTPLAGQMFHLLVERISGLTNRRVFYLPFSRDVTMNIQQIEAIQRLFEKCARVQGVLVTQPEHMLSFVPLKPVVTKFFGVLRENDLRKEEIDGGLVILEDGDDIVCELLHVLRVYPHELTERRRDIIPTPLDPLLVLEGRIVELDEKRKTFSHLGYGETSIVVAQASQANGNVWMTELAP
ncbi:hypothetical protein M413DRAFT_26859 [Hebeloma cylindrosporum]|uniref:ubiquitinyl hydrolase 1 n=1 Tax=Hebeloma cylindrosporum TaxID=76867 RepID=A0A0C2XZ18_HEBCY|nr:hypothetical protein M413DRAFT_26859 [Hebeloma cylindrosporum h7]